jgi:hypothetical protein
MSDALTNPPSLGGSPGEPVPEVDPEDLSAIWQETRDLQAKHAGQNVAVGFDFLEASVSREQTHRRSGIAQP